MTFGFAASYLRLELVEAEVAPEGDLQGDCASGCPLVAAAAATVASAERADRAAATRRTKRVQDLCMLILRNDTTLHDIE